MYFLKADSDKFFRVSAKMVEHTVSYISLQLTVLTKVVLGHLPARGIAPLHLEKKKKKKSGAGGFLISGDLASGLRWADIFANEWAAGLRRGEQIKKKTCQKLAIGTTAANIKKKEKKKEKKFKQYNKLLQYRKNIAWTLYTVQVQHNDTQPTYLLYLYNFESIHGCWPKATKTMFNFYVKHQCDWCGFKQQTWGAIWFVT